MAHAEPGKAPRPLTAHLEATRVLRRRVLLEAGITPLLAEQPWATIRMTDVAAAAGVSRQTLYDEFGSRQGLAEAYVASETERFLGMVDTALAAHGSDPRSAVVAAMTTFLTAAEAGGLLRAIVTDEGNHELLALITTHGESVLDASAGRLTDFFVQRWPGADEAGARLAARSLVRLALSYATQPDGPPEASAAEVADILTPFLERTIAGPVEA